MTVPSPALDLLLYRKVMANLDGDAYIEDRPEHLLPGEKPHLLVCWDLEGGSFEKWSPSTCMSDTWDIIKKLSLLDPRIGCQHQHGCAPVFTVELVGYKPVSAPSAELAICLAALATA